MSFCQNCGAEVAGNFCPNCGTRVGSAGNAQTQSIVYNNADVKPRYTTVSIALVYPGFALLLSILLLLLPMSIVFLLPSTPAFSPLTGIILIAFLVIAVFLAVLCFRYGFKQIRQRTPKELIGKTRRSFLIRALLFVFGWGITIAGCVYIIGIPLRVWRVGLYVSRPKDDEYTAFVDGKMIPVTRVVDLDYSSDRLRYMYVDDCGTYYRPPLGG